MPKICYSNKSFQTIVNKSQKLSHGLDWNQQKKVHVLEIFLTKKIETFLERWNKLAQTFFRC
jgi:hypothetical protein